MKTLVWILSHWRDLCAALAYLCGCASVVTGLAPMSASRRSKVMAAIRWASLLVHADEPGTFKMPGTHGPKVSIDRVLGTASMLAVYARDAGLAGKIDALRTTLAPLTVPKPSPLPPVPPAAALVLLGLLIVPHLGCSASQVHTQAVIATGTSDAFNRAQPIVLASFVSSTKAHILAVCCTRAAMQAVADRDEAQFAPVIAGWEAAR